MCARARARVCVCMCCDMHLFVVTCIEAGKRQRVSLNVHASESDMLCESIVEKMTACVLDL